MISVIVPIYNELTNLPTLLASIRKQCGLVRYIFVDNGSKDGSYEFMTEQNEVQNGTWYLVTETRGGKSFALRSGLTVAKEIGSSWCGCLDADSEPASSDWEAAITDRISAFNPEHIGYIYGPVIHTFGEYLNLYPNFHKSFRAYESVLLSRIMPKIGWFACGQYCFFPTDHLSRIYSRFHVRAAYLGNKRQNKGIILPESDVRDSLEMLNLGGTMTFCPEAVKSDATDVLRDIYSWYGDYHSFRYRRDSKKTDLDDDLSEKAARDLIRGRARKIVTRNLAFLIMIDRKSGIRQRASQFFGFSVDPIQGYLDRYSIDEIIWGDNRREDLISAFDNDGLCQKMIDFIDDLMYREFLNPSVPSELLSEPK